MKVKLREIVLTVGVVYFRPNLDFVQALELLQQAIEDVEDRAGNEIIIIGGDFNARVGEANLLPEEIVENTCLFTNVTNSDKMINLRGPALIDCMESKGYILLNGRTPSDRPAQPTFHSKVGASVIDLAFVNVSNASEIKDFGIIPVATLSDHFPGKVAVSADPVLNPIEARNVEAKSTEKVLKWVPEKAASYQREISQSDRVLNTLGVRSESSLYTNMIEAIKETTKKLEMNKCRFDF